MAGEAEAYKARQRELALQGMIDAFSAMSAKQEAKAKENEAKKLKALEMDLTYGLTPGTAQSALFPESIETTDEKPGFWKRAFGSWSTETKKPEAIPSTGISALAQGEQVGGIPSTTPPAASGISGLAEALKNSPKYQEALNKEKNEARKRELEIKKLERDIAVDPEDKKFQRQKELIKYKYGLEEKKKETEGSKQGPVVFEKAKQTASAKDLAAAISSLPKKEETLEQVRAARNSVIDYEGKSWLGLGPVATLGGARTAISPDLQKLEALMKNLSLKNMVQMFSGMSKAIDTGAERAAYEATQAGVGKYPKTSLNILLGMESVLLKDTAVAEQMQTWAQQYGTLDGFHKANPILNGLATSMIDPNGNMVLVNKSDVPRLEKSGHMTIDKYIDRVAKTGYKQKAFTPRGAPSVTAAPQGPTLSQKDAVYVEWAMKNPNNPTAQKILMLNGVNAGGQ